MHVQAHALMVVQAAFNASTVIAFGIACGSCHPTQPACPEHAEAAAASALATAAVVHT